MNMKNRTLLISFACMFSVCAGLRAIPPERVLVVYNANWSADRDGDGTQDSLQVADYYVGRRGVPAANMLGVACSTGTRHYYSSSEFTAFYDEMVTPIKNKLAALGPTDIDIILLCHGVPRQVPDSSGGTACLDNALIGINYITGANNIAWRVNSYRENTPTFGADMGPFDHAIHKFFGRVMYLVTRLDGPGPPLGPMDLVDQALYGERYVYPEDGYYRGNYVVDSRYGQGGSVRFTDEFLLTDPAVTSGSYATYGEADKNMAFAEHYVLGIDLPLKWENTTNSLEIGEAGAEFSDLTSAESSPGVLFYGGWYNYGLYRDVWEWLPGSILCDLNSNSRYFGENALQRGATAYAGVIGEPFLTGHARPNVLLYYVLQGYSFAEASVLSTPSVGWKPINVGDPLYAPMQAKTPVLDSQFPQLTGGCPVVSGDPTSGTRTITVVVDTTGEPDLVRTQVDYGFTTSYGLVADSGPGYWCRREIELHGLLGDSTYHYRLTLTDPVGNTTVTGDCSFDTGAVPNTAPAADDQTVICEHDRDQPVTLTGSDPEGNALSFQVVTDPAHGTLGGSAPVLIYTPAPGYDGPDGFTFKVDDGALESGVATVTIDVMPTEEVVLVLQQDLDGYAGARDTQVYDGSADRNYGGLASIGAYGDGRRRMLLAFDLSAIPPAATISSATLDLWCHSISNPPDGGPIRLYRVTRSWVEGTSTGGADTQDGCTWLEHDYTDHDASAAGDWTAPGGDHDETAVHAERSTSDIVVHAWLRWAVRDLVQDWVAVTVANHGMLIRTLGGSSTISYRSGEYGGDPSLRPKLTVRYFIDQDSDGDTIVDREDCAPLDGNLWSEPSEAIGLVVTREAVDNLTWDEPLEPGSTAMPLYDVLMSRTASDFSGATCVASDLTRLAATDAAAPGPNEVLCYLVRAENDCGANMGGQSDGTRRTGPNCP